MTSTTADTPLSISVERTAGQVVISLDGDLDVLSADDLQKIGEAALTTPTDRLVISCTDLAFLDSTGLRCVLLLRVTCHEVGATMTLADPPPFVRTMLDITGLTDILLADEAP